MHRMGWIAGVACCVASIQAEQVQLDLSGGFNADAWCGPEEYQSMRWNWVTNNPTVYLSSLQGKEPLLSYYLAEQYAGAQMVGCSSTQQYAIPSNTWWYGGALAWVVDHEGTPENGVLTGALDRVYHIASHSGNTTLPGDWLSPADCGVPADWPTSKMANRPNSLCMAAPHDKTVWQVTGTTATLPEGQQRKYSDVNFVVAAWSSAAGSRNARIRATYADASTQTLYATPTAAPPSGLRWGPCLEDARSDTNAVDFAAVWAATQCNIDNTRAVGDKNTTLFEFAEPVALDSEKVLVALTVEDAEPTRNWSARGFSVFAATATAVPLPPAATVLQLR